jgi:hypothetical protein
VQRLVQFDLDVEIVLDDRLAAAGHENQMLDAGFERLIDDILDDRLVHHRQHLLRNRLGRGKETGPETCNGENGFADFALVGHWHLLAVHLSLA